MFRSGCVFKKHAQLRTIYCPPPLSNLKKDMDRNLKIRLIVSKILTNVEISEENIGMSRNRENSMTIALWEGLARTSLNLEF